MRGLLLAGYRADSAEDSHFSLKTTDQKSLLDLQIEHLEQNKLEVVVTLAGLSADLVLRRSLHLPRVELVFDTHTEEEVSLMTNIKAGLALTTDAAIVQPVEGPLFDPHIIQQLLKDYYYAGLRTDIHIFTWAKPEELPDPRLFPCLITRSGNAFLKQTPDLRDLNDARLRISSVTGANRLASEAESA